MQSQSYVSSAPLMDIAGQGCHWFDAQVSDHFIPLYHAGHPANTIIVVLIVGLIGCILAVVFFFERIRRKALADTAAGLGLQFTFGKNRHIPDQYRFIDLFRQGKDGYAYNVMQGEYRGYSVMVFDYCYHTRNSNGKTKIHYHNMTMLQLERSFPELRIYPETLGSRIAQLFGFGDINFESIEFSKAFTVRSKDRKFAYDICHVRMIEYLLGHRTITLEIDQNWLAMPRGKKLEPASVEEQLNAICTIRKLFPRYLFQE